MPFLPLILRVMLLLALVAGSASFAVAANAQKLLFVSEKWQDATNADGSGFYWDILRAVYQPAGYELEFRVVPYVRAVKTVLLGKAHGWVASYLHEEPVIYPRTPFDTDNVMGVFRKGNLALERGQQALQGKKLGWIRGYRYDKYLDVPVDKHLLNSRENGLKMVVHKRLDVFLDAQYDIEAALEAGVIDKQAVDVARFLDLELYMAFASTDQGRKLAELWDRRMRELHETGELQELYKAAAYTDYYPF